MEKFECCNCRRNVSSLDLIGTKHRNHCPFCLWSKHVDLKKSGDRKAKCSGEMKPIGLTFKQEGKDKYGKTKQGEIMIIHECLVCGKISINRIAGDDSAETILKVLEESQKMPPDKKGQLKKHNIEMLNKNKRGALNIRLFGRNF